MLTNATLKLISEHNGEWGWYKLDRALNYINVPTEGKLMKVLTQLESSGLISARKSQGMTSSLYSITPAGEKILEKESSSDKLHSDKLRRSG